MRLFGDDILEPVDPPTGPSIWWAIGIVAAVAVITVTLIVLLRKKKRGE